MAAQPTPTPVPQGGTVLWARQVPDNDPLDPFDPFDPFGDGTATDTDTDTDTGAEADTDTDTSTTPTTTSSSTASRSTSTTRSSTSTSRRLTSTTSSTSTSSTTSRTSSTTSSTSSSSTVTLTSTSSVPTTLTSTSASVSGTSTVNVVITRTAFSPSTTVVSRPTLASSSGGGGTNGGMIGGIVGGVVGGLGLLALIIAIAMIASRRRARTGHAYFLCFGTPPSKAEKGDLGHGGGAWPTFDPNDDHAGAAAFGAAAAAGGAAGAVASSRRRRRAPQTHATLPPGFEVEDPEAYAQVESSLGHDGYDGYSGGYSQQGFSQGHSGSHEMQEHPVVAGALAAGAAAGGVYYGSTHSRRRSSNGQVYGSNDALTSGGISPGATHAQLEPQAPAAWTLPMLGAWTGDQGPYSAAGVGRAPQAFHMMGPGEGGRPRDNGPDYSHFDPPEVRDARAREAAAAALASGSYSGSPPMQSTNLVGTATSPRRSHRRLSSNQVSPSHENAGAPSPPAYVDASEDVEEVGDEAPRRLHLTNAEPEETDDDSSRGGPTRRDHSSHKDHPPAATYRSS